MLTVFYADQEAYELTGNQYSVYGIQYQPGFDNAVRVSCHVDNTPCSNEYLSISLGYQTTSLRGHSSNLALPPTRR